MSVMEIYKRIKVMSCDALKQSLKLAIAREICFAKQHEKQDNIKGVPSVPVRI